jgi:hypothetical protein
LQATERLGENVIAAETRVLASLVTQKEVEAQLGSLPQFNASPRFELATLRPLVRRDRPGRRPLSREAIFQIAAKMASVGGNHGANPCHD